MTARRMTKQRKAVLDYLQSVYTHPTAEMIYDALKINVEGLTLATVYRNLHLLTEEKKALKLEFNKEFHFDGHTEAHQHLTCNQCGKIDDIHNEKIQNYITHQLKDNKNIESFNITFNGTCKNCS